MSKKLAAEFLGSLFLVMGAVSSMIFFTYVFEAPKGVSIIANALAVAFILTALIEMFGPISGAHFNPIVTCIMWLDKKIHGKTAALFLLVQTLGGLVGVALSHAMFWAEVGVIFEVCTNVRSHTYLGEVIGSFILILAILLLVKGKSTHIPMMVGFLVGGQLMATSSTMFANPQVTIARMFTPTTSGIRPMDAMVFIAMQFTGALLAYGVYKLFFSQNEVKS